MTEESQEEKREDVCTGFPEGFEGSEGQGVGAQVGVGVRVGALAGVGAGVDVGVGVGPPRERGLDPLVCDAELDCESGVTWAPECDPLVVALVVLVTAEGIGEDCCWAE